MYPDALIPADNSVALADAAFDQPASPLERLVVIAASGRSGSYMLARMLRQLGYGIALEYFNSIYRSEFARRWHAADAPDDAGGFLDALIAHRTVNGCCAIKCMPPQLRLLAAGLKASRRAVPPLYIHLWRRDTLAQAISMRLARQSGIWDHSADPTTSPDPDIDPQDLDALRATRRGVFADELGWRAYFHHVEAPVVHVAYEDLIADREGELGRLVRFIDPMRVQPLRLELVTEPRAPTGLWARQHLSTTEREALRRAYEARFGASPPLPDP